MYMDDVLMLFVIFLKFVNMLFVRFEGGKLNMKNDSLNIIFFFV